MKFSAIFLTLCIVSVSVIFASEGYESDSGKTVVSIYDEDSDDILLESSPFKFKDRAQWQDACAKLPHNIDISSKTQSAFTHHPEIGLNLGLAWQEFSKVLAITLKTFKHGELADESLWVNGKPDAKFYDVLQDVFNPYVRKEALQPGQDVILHGDLHGDIHSLNKYLQDLEDRGRLKAGSFELVDDLVDKKTKLIFCGDYVDRGFYGVEVLYALLRLKHANEDRVVMIRGNHEEKKLTCYYGFEQELITTFGYRAGIKEYDKIYRLYDFLPVAVYLGCRNNYLQCCHGGLEYGYKPKDLLEGAGKFELLGELRREDFTDYHKEVIAEEKDRINFDTFILQCSSAGCCPWSKRPSLVQRFVPEDITSGSPDSAIGFVWGDFLRFGCSRWGQRGLEANQQLTKDVLRYQNKNSSKNVKGLIRAHQHHASFDNSDPLNIMKAMIAGNGVCKMWQPAEQEFVRSVQDDMVVTLNVSPDSVYGTHCGFGFDTSLKLTLQENYEDWRMQVNNRRVIRRAGYRQAIKPIAVEHAACQIKKSVTLPKKNHERMNFAKLKYCQLCLEQQARTESVAVGAPLKVSK